jgi:transposase
MLRQESPTRTINRLRWHLHRLDPDLERAARRLPGPSLDQVAAWLAATPSSVQVAICQELTATIAALTARIERLTGELGQRVVQLAPNLLSLPGCGVLTGAKLLAETAGVAGFVLGPALPCTPGSRPSRSARGVATATGCVVAATGSSTPRSTALPLPSFACPAQAYYRRRRAQGGSTGDAVRAGKRRITRAVYQQLKLAEERLRTAPPAAA